MQTIQSLPIKLHWLGWRSDTVTLQRNGWRLATYEKPEIMHRGNTVELALKFEHNNQNIYGHGVFDYMPERLHWQNEHMNPYRGPVQVQMSLANVVVLRTNYQHRGVRFHEIDAEPRMMKLDDIPLHQLCWFRRVPPEDKDLIVTPPTFDEILQMALDHQAPKQKELREKARKQIRGDQIIRVAA